MRYRLVTDSLSNWLKGPSSGQSGHMRHVCSGIPVLSAKVDLMAEDTTPSAEDASLKVLIEAGLISPPTPGVCPHRDVFGMAGYCGRPLLQTTNFCFWHARDAGKYDPDVVARHFGRGITLKEAIETEVAQGRSLNGAFLHNAPLRGSFLTQGVCLDGADLRGADLSCAGLSYSCLRNANLAFCNLDFAFLGDADLKGR